MQHYRCRVPDDSPTRFQDDVGLAWQYPAEVVCPRCGRRATVRVDLDHFRLTCSRCPLALDWTGQYLTVVVDGRPVTLRRMHGAWFEPESARYVSAFSVQEGVEPHFGVPLWLRAECCGGHLLWANNEEHLNYLENFVSATLREHRPGGAGLHLVLPTWLKLAKNRDEILRSLRRIRTTLDSRT